LEEKGKVPETEEALAPSSSRLKRSDKFARQLANSRAAFFRLIPNALGAMMGFV
jgi:hypothetical protein